MKHPTIYLCGIHPIAISTSTVVPEDRIGAQKQYMKMIRIDEEFAHHVGWSSFRQDRIEVESSSIPERFALDTVR